MTTKRPSRSGDSWLKNISGALLVGAVAVLSLSAAPLKPADLDKLLAPVALYPDALLSQMLLSTGNPGKVGALGEWLNGQSLTGTELRDAAVKAGFDESYAALTMFPDVVHWMAGQPDWLAKLGKAFTDDKKGVFDSIQRLRKKAQDAGKLKTTPQQTVETETTSSGQQVIVIEPSNPQVVYVPQYNPATVYTTSTVVVQESSSSADAALAGMIGFTAGIAIGAAIDNDYYYGPYGWGGGFHMYNDAWDDYYDHREDAREDWMDHREDMYDERGDIAEDRQEQRTDRAETRNENRPETQAARQQQRSSTTANRETRSGSSSDAFSGYSSGKSERAASKRGSSSRSSSRSSGGGGRRR
jgi:hypothetical protein